MAGGGEERQRLEEELVAQNTQQGQEQRRSSIQGDHHRQGRNESSSFKGQKGQLDWTWVTHVRTGKAGRQVTGTSSHRAGVMSNFFKKGDEMPQRIIKQGNRSDLNLDLKSQKNNSVAILTFQLL